MLGSLDKSVIEWDLDIGVARRSFSEHSGPIFALQFLAERLSAQHIT